MDTKKPYEVQFEIAGTAAMFTRPPPPAPPVSSPPPPICRGKGNV